MTKYIDFVDYVMGFYGHLKRDDVWSGLCARLVSKEDNGHGVRLCDIPFEGDSFDRTYVYWMISQMNKKRFAA